MLIENVVKLYENVSERKAAINKKLYIFIIFNNILFR